MPNSKASKKPKIGEREKELRKGKCSYDHLYRYQAYVEAFGRTRVAVGTSSAGPSFDWESMHEFQTVATALAIDDAVRGQRLKTRNEFAEALWATFDNAVDRQSMSPTRETLRDLAVKREQENKGSDTSNASVTAPS
jgi:hypothetical protein